MNTFTIFLHVVVISMAVLRLLDKPLFSMSVGFGGGLIFSWKSFWWFLLGFGAFINLVYSLL